MRVVADSHTLIWYLLGDPDQRLSQTAREVLGEAEITDGIAVSVASVLDIWYVTQTRQVLSTEQLASIVEVLNEPFPVTARLGRSSCRPVVLMVQQDEGGGGDGADTHPPPDTTVIAADALGPVIRAEAKSSHERLTWTDITVRRLRDDA